MSAAWKTASAHAIRHRKKENTSLEKLILFSLEKLLISRGSFSPLSTLTLARFSFALPFSVSFFLFSPTTTKRNETTFGSARNSWHEAKWHESYSLFDSKTPASIDRTRVLHRAFSATASVACGRRGNRNSAFNRPHRSFSRTDTRALRESRFIRNERRPSRSNASFLTQCQVARNTSRSLDTIRNVSTIDTRPKICHGFSVINGNAIAQFHATLYTMLCTHSMVPKS